MSSPNEKSVASSPKNNQPSPPPEKSSLEVNPTIIEEEKIEDKYQLPQNEDSNILSNKLLFLLQECLLSPVDKFNKEIFTKYDKEHLFDKESLDHIDIEINNFKISFIEEQYRIIKELITKYDLIKGLKKFSDEKNFSEELDKYNINSDILSFIGPLSNKINEVKDKENDINGNNNEIEKFLFEILEMNYYNKKTVLLEESIKALDEQIEDLKNKNKIL